MLPHGDKLTADLSKFGVKSIGAMLRSFAQQGVGQGLSIRILLFGYMELDHPQQV